MLNRFDETMDTRHFDNIAIAPARNTMWTVIVPFHNERSYLPGCIASLAAQTVRCKLVLVNNGSTDGSADVAREICNSLGVDAVHLFEGRPGKVAALQRGLEEASTEYTATCDADTVYPANYLENASRLLADRGVVAAVAATSPVEASRFRVWFAGARLQLTSFVLRQQCLNGGAGQVFRTAALRGCGGFDPALWGWVLEDHEIMARIERLGKIVYHRMFHCHPAHRPRSVDCAGWTLDERVRYHLTPGEKRLSYFHEYLGPKLRRRALSSEKLRRLGGIPVHG